MAGERYGSVGAAFSQGFDNYLLEQEKQRRQAMLDQIAQDREARLAEADKQDREIRRQQIEMQAQNMQAAQEDKKLAAHMKKRADLMPGDVPSPELIKEAKDLGVPLRLGAAPVMDNPAPASLEAVDEEPMAQVPLAPDANRPYMGTRADVARSKLADVIEGDNDPNIVTAQALRLGIDPKEIPLIQNAERGPKSKITPEIGMVAKGADGKVIPGLVAMGEDGAMLLNGQPLAEGVTVERAPAPRDPLLDQLTRSQIDRNNREARAASGGGTGSEGGKLSPENQRLAEDYASGDITEQMLTGMFGRTAPERAALRQVFKVAREINPNLDSTARRVGVDAYAKTLKSLTDMHGAVEAYAKAADANTRRLEQIMKRIPDTGFAGTPNDIARWLAKVGGSEDVAEWNVFMKSVQAEYQRLIDNPRLVGQSTVSATKKFEEILDGSATIPQLKRTMEALRIEADNRRRGLEETMDETRTAMQTAGGATGGNGMPAAGGKKRSLDDLWNAAHGGK